jgi:DNA-binding NarL/FixJ family response regulator
MREMGVFSASEEQILQLLLVGFPTRKIAHDLDMTVATVKAGMRQILRKIKARSEALPSTDAQWLAAH